MAILSSSIIRHRILFFATRRRKTRGTAQFFL